MGKEIREVCGGEGAKDKQLTFGPEWCGPSVAEGKDKGPRDSMYVVASRRSAS